MEIMRIMDNALKTLSKTELLAQTSRGLEADLA